MTPRPSQLPWRVEPGEIPASGVVEVWGADDNIVIEAAYHEEAALIVTAVNQHAHLLARVTLLERLLDEACTIATGADPSARDVMRLATIRREASKEE